MSARLPLHFVPNDVADWQGVRVRIKSVLPVTRMACVYHLDGRPDIAPLEELELVPMPKEGAP